jgi:AcrR family transcriptional regulator
MLSATIAVNERSSTGVTAERIHDAALTLFNDRGYTGTTVRELADACDLTPGAIYNHYASKDALLFAIVDRVHDLADNVLSETLRRVGNDPRRQLEALAAAFTAFHIARPRETRVANRDYIYLPGVERESVVRRRRRVRALFADVLREGEHRGLFSFGELGSEDAIQAASMAILNMVVLVAEWFDPAGARSAQDTAALHGRLALRIASGTAGPSTAAEALLAPGHGEAR